MNDGKDFHSEGVGNECGRGYLPNETLSKTACLPTKPHPLSDDDAQGDVHGKAQLGPDCRAPDARQGP